MAKVLSDDLGTRQIRTLGMTITQKILDLNAFDVTNTGGLDPAAAALVARRRRTFGPTSMLFYTRPLNLVRGESVWLFDADGSRYLDAYNNVPSVGHCHPRVVEAVAAQMAELNTHTRYLYDIVYTYAEALLSTFPRDLSNVVFTCTGSESVDLAMRIARNVTGGQCFIATENAYHGNTTSATEVSPSSANAEPPNGNVFVVPAPDHYRQGQEAGALFVEAVASAIEQIKKQGKRLAGFIADSAFSSDGVYPDDPGYLASVAASVRKAGGLFIADEVQPGFARTGEKMWGFERHAFVPDIVVMGKPMGNGYPIGAVVVKPALLDMFGAKSGYFNTFGGSPAASAAGLAVLQVLSEEKLQTNSLQTGRYLRDKLSAIGRSHARIGDIRGVGLYLAVEFVKDQATKQPDKDTAVRAVNLMRDQNVLVGLAGRHGNVWKIRPPLCFKPEHADRFAEAFAKVLQNLP